ncbi:MAG: hypothetical protein AB1775_06220 [Bacteroidota bacterium]
MKYRLESFFIFIISSGCILFLLLYIFGNENIHVYSAIAQLISLLLCYLVYDPEVDSLNKNALNETKQFSIKHYFDTDINLLNKKQITYFIIAVLLFNVIFAVWNLYIITSKIPLTNDNSESIIAMFKALSITTIIITQFGGFAIQSIIIFMLSIIMGSNNHLNTYLKIVGFSYIGFVLLTLILICINTFLIPNQISLSDFNTTFEKSLLHGWLAKSGEYLVLFLISLGIYNSDKFSFPKSIFITIFPSILLTSFQLFFSQLL